jgi:hypothetical protein
MFNQQLSRILQRYRDRGRRQGLGATAALVLLVIIMLYVVL